MVLFILPYFGKRKQVTYHQGVFYILLIETLVLFIVPSCVTIILCVCVCVCVCVFDRVPLLFF